MGQYAFHINSSACSGCKTCQVACKDKNDLRPGVNWRRVYDIQGGEWKFADGVILSTPFSYNLSLSCFNCEIPVCTNACPTKAIYENDNGFVIIDQEMCIGCRYCEWVCPYGAPQFDPDVNRMTKCNLCEDYVIAGGKPSCVDACPMRALDFGTIEEMSKKYEKNIQVFPLPDPALTKPGMIVRPHKDAGKANSDTAEAFIREDL